MHLRKIILSSCTFWVFIICVILFAWNEKQAYTVKKQRGELSLAVGLTPIQRVFLFDFPKTMASLNEVIVRYDIRTQEDISNLSIAGQRQLNKAEAIPMWNGLIGELTQGGIDSEAPLFEEIREGQVWRLFSPSLLHKDLIHLVFNMAWLWILGLQIEARLRRVRYLLLILLMGIVSNVSQYLMGGPYFLGFSGVVVGMAGFIWARQKKAPWEGYPLPRATALFIFYFVLVMMALEGVSLAARFVFSIGIPINIANTAHVAGGVSGLLLGRCSFFSRR